MSTPSDYQRFGGLGKDCCRAQSAAWGSADEEKLGEKATPAARERSREIFGKMEFAQKHEKG
jgi:hypothetical protein